MVGSAVPGPSGTIGVGKSRAAPRRRVSQRPTRDHTVDPVRATGTVPQRACPNRTDHVPRQPERVCCRLGSISPPVRLGRSPCSPTASRAARTSRRHRGSRHGLTDLGYGLLRFDFTGLGASEGEFANTNFSSNVDDLVAAAGWLREHHAGPQLLVGHSLGGAAVIVAATQIPEVAAVATIGAPSDAGHVAQLFDGALDEIAEHGRGVRRSARSPFHHPSATRRRSAQRPS